MDAAPAGSARSRWRTSSAARLYYDEQLRDAFFGFLIPDLIVWVIGT